jgi:hypothetical protein
VDASATDLDSGTDLEELESNLAEGGRGKISARLSLGQQHREHETGEG